MFQRDLLKTWYPSVLSLQLTASPPARTVAPAAGRIPACAARASRAPAARRWLRSRCTSAMGAVWGAYSRGSTYSRKTNSAEGPQKRLSMLLRCRPRDLRPPGSQSTPCKCYPSLGQIIKVGNYTCKVMDSKFWLGPTRGLWCICFFVELARYLVHNSQLASGAVGNMPTTHTLIHNTFFLFYPFHPLIYPLRSCPLLWPLA